MSFLRSSSSIVLCSPRKRPNPCNSDASKARFPGPPDSRSSCTRHRIHKEDIPHDHRETWRCQESEAIERISKLGGNWTVRKILSRASVDLGSVERMLAGITTQHADRDFSGAQIRIAEMVSLNLFPILENEFIPVE